MHAPRGHGQGWGLDRHGSGLRQAGFESVGHCNGAIVRRQSNKVPTSFGDGIVRKAGSGVRQPRGRNWHMSCAWLVRTGPSRRLLVSLAIAVSGVIGLSACSTDQHGSPDRRGDASHPARAAGRGRHCAASRQIRSRLLSRREGSGADPGRGKERLRQPLRDRAGAAGRRAHAPCPTRHSRPRSS